MLVISVSPPKLSAASTLGRIDPSGQLRQKRLGLNARQLADLLLIGLAETPVHRGYFRQDQEPFRLEPACEQG